MSARKERMTVTVDRALVEAANEAVASGRASSVSTWVNAALADRVAKERQLQALAEAVAGYEAEFGAISAAELIAQQRHDRRTSIAVREHGKKHTQGRRRRAA
jgi:Arc/MetJ-type ribon-helix-helix transcriptional regulator